MTEKPNILYILNDHQTYYGHGTSFGAPEVKTLSFDGLARESIEFTQAYTACPLCGPARRTMLTGLFPHNHKELLNEVNYPFDHETYLEVLGANGYENYYFGKWHAGPGSAHDFDCSGFSYPEFGNPYITEEYKQYLEGKNLPQFEVEIKGSFYNPEWTVTKNLGVEVGKKYSPTSKNYDECVAGLMTSPLETHEAIFLANLAIDQFKEIAIKNSEKPFNMRVDFWGPHPPYFVSKEFLDLYNPSDFPKYPNFEDDLHDKPEIYQYDMYFPISKNGKLIRPNPLEWTEWQKFLSYAYAHASLIDYAGGLILKSLEELGLAENTIVIWTLDHGDGLACHGGHFDKDCYMPQELIKIPLAIRYPEITKSNQKSDKFVSNIDIAPTILDIAGCSFSNKIDGRSLLPLLKGKTIDWREDIMVEMHGHKHLHLGRALISDKYKFIYNERDLDELYDLEEDPYELNNLINDPQYSKIIDDLEKRLKIWREKTNDNMTKRMIRKVIKSKSNQP
ncbi:MAG: sulfatase-like hydrolase/transferase [Candidatus Lokiarchaeota archaeon]|nr:sulfatase-like hydrolase/transferase [Candidatus Lokiarchaeota archaeon]MBD3198628.1 sulfatase-like hydrolase/transferase [Candidatus Lokiarchaeota archaeon]